METIFSESPRKILQNKEEIERKLDVKIKVQGRKIEIQGSPVDEYEARQIIEALDFGFRLKDAMRLTEENVVLRKLPIKRFTNRKDMEEVRGRIIGTEGQTRRTVEEVSGCAVVIHNKEVGLIGFAENIEEATTAVTNLIKGSKQANVYRFLERMNVAKRGTPAKKKTYGRKKEEKKVPIEEDYRIEDDSESE